MEAPRRPMSPRTFAELWIPSLRIPLSTNNFMSETSPTYHIDREAFRAFLIDHSTKWFNSDSISSCPLATYLQGLPDFVDDEVVVFHYNFRTRYGSFYILPLWASRFSRIGIKRTGAFSDFLDGALPKTGAEFAELLDKI